MTLTRCSTRSITIDVLLSPDEWNEGLRRDAVDGLTATPKTLPPTWLYDDVGSALYDEITRVPEYYPARTERGILDEWADDMVSLAAPDTLVELGSGTAEKTETWLDAMAATGRLERYVPFDVSESTLRQSASRIADSYGIDLGALRKCQQADRHSQHRDLGRRVEQQQHAGGRDEHCCGGNQPRPQPVKQETGRNPSQGHHRDI